jgi:hypothetical protein
MPAEALSQTSIQGTMSIMGKEGDLKVTWNSDEPDEVAAARVQFSNLVGKGYLAFKTDKKGGQGEQMREFDVTAERVILVKQLKGG